MKIFKLILDQILAVPISSLFFLSMISLLSYFFIFCPLIMLILAIIKGDTIHILLALIFAIIGPLGCWVDSAFNIDVNKIDKYFTYACIQIGIFSISYAFFYRITL